MSSSASSAVWEDRAFHQEVVHSLACVAEVLNKFGGCPPPALLMTQTHSTKWKGERERWKQLLSLQQTLLRLCPSSCPAPRRKVCAVSPGLDQLQALQAREHDDCRREQVGVGGEFVEREQEGGGAGGGGHQGGKRGRVEEGEGEGEGKQSERGRERCAKEALLPLGEQDPLLDPSRTRLTSSAAPCAWPRWCGPAPCPCGSWPSSMGQTSLGPRRLSRPSWPPAHAES